MAQGDYELVFYGQLLAGALLHQVKANVAQLFKTTTDQIERMFTGNRVVIRNKLDAETALKYVVAMQKQGAVCQIELMGQPGVKVNLSPMSEPSTNSGSAPVQPRTSTEVDTTAAPEAKPKAEPKANLQQAKKSGLNLAGEKVDEILAGKGLILDPVGIRLSEKNEVVAPVFDHLDRLTIAPVGSDLTDKKEQIPVAPIDISYLSLKKEGA